MRNVRTNSTFGKAIAVVCSDIHLSDKPPVYRSKEKDWFEAMQRPLQEMEELAHELDVDILCAGDIFDKWNCSPALINFAMVTLPKMKSIPGQHDLPYHSYDQLEKSAYYSLSLHDRLDHLSNDTVTPYHSNNNFAVHPYGWNASLKMNDEPQMLNIALIHKYIWRKGNTYPGADPTGHVEMIAKKLSHCDVIICGDNHSGFEYKAGSSFIFNCGTFMRRTLADENYSPGCGILYENGTVRRYLFDTKEEVYLEREQIQNSYEFEMDKLKKELESLGSSNIDFVEELRRRYKEHKLEDQTIQIIEDSINE